MYIGVYLVGDKKISLLNKKYKGKEGPTDVLSFNYLNYEYSATNDDLGDAEKTTKARGKDKNQKAANLKGLKRLKSNEYLGDIVVCVDQALRQAPDYKNTFEQEVAQLVAHGVLHLLGVHHKGDNYETGSRFGKSGR